MHLITRLLIILLIIFSLFIPLYILEVVDQNNQIVYQQMAKVNGYFDIRWTHSVTLQPVIETYKLEGIDRIPIVKMVFDDYGPNLPAQPEEDQIWIIKDGQYIVTNYNRYFQKVPVTIGAVIADHTLIYNTKETVLKDIYRPGGFVYIQLSKKSISQYLVKEVEIWLTKILSQ